MADGNKKGQEHIPARLGNRGRAAKQMQAELGLPHLLQQWSPKKPYSGGRMRNSQKWKTLAARLPQIEAELCAWEAANPEAHRALPWYEAREAFKASKERGEVVWPEWWELAGGVAHVQWAVGRATEGDAVFGSRVSRGLSEPNPNKKKPLSD